MSAEKTLKAVEGLVNQALREIEAEHVAAMDSLNAFLCGAIAKRWAGHITSR